MARHNSDDTLSPEAQSLLQIEKNRPDDSDLPRAEISAKLSETLGFSLELLSSVQSSTRDAPTGQTSSTLMKSLLSSGAIFLSGAVVGGSFVHFREPRHVEEQPQMTPPATPPVVEIEPPKPPSEDRPEQPTAREAPLPPSVTKPFPKSVTPQKETLPAADSTLQLENATLDRARTALLRHAFQDALLALDEHERNFPKGRLSEERDVLKIQVFLSLGRKQEAKELAETLRSKYPDSLMLPAVKTLIEEHAP